MVNRKLLLVIGTLLLSLPGLYIAYRLALRRNRRSEYNALADKLFLNVNRTVKASHAHNFSINRADIALIRRRMGWLKRRAFDQAVAGYEKAAANTYQDHCGHVHFRSPDEVNKALARIAKCLKQK